ncbi:MAG: ABC-F family ATP-binding cassette domain-containing protein [Bacteroidales bacterium]|nr:ABC-F family ATP-binding cassette domain-containing protein [Bacteroidales bacterium]
MNYLSVEKLSKYFGDLLLFEDISFGLEKGEKTALIANNGTGKSTLFNILAGMDAADSGKLSFRNGIRLGYLQQDPVFDENMTVKDLVQSGHSAIYTVISKYKKALEQQSMDHSPASRRVLEAASDEMDFYRAWDFERRVSQYLSLFRVSIPDQVIGTFSGGQRKRLALALVLIDDPDILLLDEPTNHLDIEMIEWLEKYLKQTSSALLMVTHDRYFLDRVCNRILEMEDGLMYRHNGNYSYFLRKKGERIANRQTEINKAAGFVRKETEWMRRMPKARTTKSKARIDSFYQKEAIANSGKKEQQIRLDVKSRRMGGNILELKDLFKSYGNINILNNFNYLFKRGERIGIVGKNGSGKSSFLNVIIEKETVDSGTVTKGETIVFGYYSQEGIQLKEDKRVIEVVTDIAEVIELGNGSSLSASQFLSYFLFPPERQFNYVSKLSGGEKKRLYLLTILIKNPNFLILDEPTNDLDLATLNKLEEFLSAYKGCLLLVSHDRYFLDHLVDHLFIFEGDGRITDFYGNYAAYHEKMMAAAQHLKPGRVGGAKAEKPKTAGLPVKKKRSYKENLEYQQLEKEIAEHEVEKAQLETALNSGGTDYETLQENASRVGELIELIDEKTFRWMELDEQE